MTSIPLVEHPTAPHSLIGTLSTTGIASFGPLFDGPTIDAWNDRLDPLFAGLSAGRATLGADVLTRTGVLQECLTPGLRSVIALTVPDARIYHAHAYEIAGGQDRSHIHAERLAGWHRDTETIHAYERSRPSHLSLFVYLTGVEAASGPFEFLPSPPSARLGGRLDAHSVTGPPGTAFVWNRSFYHRAAPNRSEVRRRILKLSWQPAGEPNDRIGGLEFAAAAATTTDDAWLSLLLGGPAGRHAGPSPRPLPATGGTPPSVVPLPFGAEVVLRGTDRLGEGLRRLRHRVAP